MKLCKSIISGIMAIAIAISLSAPAYAVGTGSSAILGAMQVAPDFGSWLWSAIKTGNSSYKWLTGDTDYCPGSGNQPGFNFRHAFVPQDTIVGGKAGTFYICQNCGLSAGEVLEPAYTDYVQTLPATGYNSAGKLTWQPSISDVDLSSSEFNYWWSNSNAPVEVISVSALPIFRENQTGTRSVECSASSTGFNVHWSGGGYSRFAIEYCFSVPVSGTYTYTDSVCHSRTLISTSGEVSSDSSNYSAASAHYSPQSPVYLSFPYGKLSSSYSSYATLSISCYFPIFEVIPDTTPSADTYNINTRPTSITGGNYGIIGDNGQITKVEDNSTIVNETNNTYYNPATGQTFPISNWSYDYSDRSYRVDYTTTSTTGDTVTNTSTVTYGDDYITITEIDNSTGDIITNNYTIYYLIEGSGSGETPVDPPAACTHNWQETNTTPATCTLPGSVAYTCSLCSQTRTDPVHALGHDWQVKQSVTTEYDDTGQLIQEGYTIYECSRCGEQYKAASGSSPPANPADPDASGNGVFSGIFGLLLDFLSFFWKTFRDFTKSGVKSFLDSLKDGTSDVFGLLNPFDWSA